MRIDDPIALLRREHDEALAALDRLGTGVGNLAAPGARQAVDQAVAFLDNEVRGHNEREEEVLFPMMERYMPAQAGPTAVMRAEHRELWDLLGRLRAALSGSAPDPAPVRATGLAVVDLLRRHIEKENAILFPMAQQMLSAEEMEEVARGMERLIAARATT
jgi:hemerythrin-like domain-containing protein